MFVRRLVAVVLAISALGACARSEPERTAPPAAPRSIDEVTGIWRSAHQTTLELRRNGTFVLITTVSDALTGKYSLSQERFTAFDTTGCGGAQGDYRIEVVVEKQLIFSEPDDPCGLRKNQLTAEPFVYG